MRIRTIKPEFWISENIGKLSIPARLLFIGLWTCADDEGKARASSRLLASLLFPYDDVQNCIDGWLDELVRENMIILYVVDGSHFLEIPAWKKHQRIDHPSKSVLPNRSDSLVTREPSRALASLREESREEGKGKEGKGNNIVSLKIKTDGHALAAEPPPPSDSIPEIPKAPTIAGVVFGGSPTMPIAGEPVRPGELFGPGVTSDALGEKKPRGVHANAIIEKWNLLPDPIPKIRSASAKRISQIKSRMHDPFFCNNWQSAIDKIPSCSFLMGKNDRNWVANIDWFLRPDSVTKIIEGIYSGKKTLDFSKQNKIITKQIQETVLITPRISYSELLKKDAEESSENKIIENDDGKQFAVRRGGRKVLENVLREIEATKLNGDSEA